MISIQQSEQPLTSNLRKMEPKMELIGSLNKRFRISLKSKRISTQNICSLFMKSRSKSTFSLKAQELTYFDTEIATFNFCKTSFERFDSQRKVLFLSATHNKQSKKILEETQMRTRMPLSCQPDWWVPTGSISIKQALKMSLSTPISTQAILWLI